MGRKKQEDEEVKSGLMVMMVSLNLILVIFFVYLNSIGVDDDRKVKKALGSLAGTFGMLPGGLHLSDGKKILVPGSPMVSFGDTHLSVGREFTRMIEDNRFEDEAMITKEGDDLIIHVAEKFLFSSGEAQLRPGSKHLLDEVGRIILKYDFPVRIEGHTDNIPVSSAKFPSNWELSASRAAAVLQYLLQEKNVQAERMTAVGFGEFQPLVPNDRPKNRAKNRRVRIVLLEAEDAEE
ncbi:MAG: flagellar motor protein MotB [Nitrospiria bacterium]